MYYTESSFGPSEEIRKPAIANSVLGVLVFIITEMMFFAAFISAYLVVAATVEVWPPADQPRLPLGASLFNTCVLVASAVTLIFAQLAFRRNGSDKTSRFWYGLTLGLGIFFVAFQGYEWTRLLSYGITVNSSNYGSFFYLLIGAHALHAIGAILALGKQYLELRKDKLSKDNFTAGALFWYFVVGLWPVLYVLVYL